MTLAAAGPAARQAASRAVPRARTKGPLRSGAKAAQFYAPRCRTSRPVFSGSSPGDVRELANQPVCRGEAMDNGASSSNGSAPANGTMEDALKRMAGAEPELAARLVVHALPAAAAPLPEDLSWRLRVEGVGEWHIAG